MTSSHDCPLCTATYGIESDLRLHLEVEHRKSELARTLVTDEFSAPAEKNREKRDETGDLEDVRAEPSP